MYKIIWIVFFLLFQLTNLIGQDTQMNQWIDSTMQSMTDDELIGQLFMVRAFSKKDTDKKAILRLIRKHHIGGICFFQGTPQRQAELSNIYQKKSKIPLLISIDGEWDLGMRFSKIAFSFPRQLTLGAIKDNTLIYEMGLKVAEHCKRVGIQFNFAPVVDINNNPNNPVINNRSFGEDVYNVTVKSNAYMLGMQDGGILACAKHFPGHGDTDVDSHVGLPVINHDMNRLDSVELVPFKHLINQGVSSIMAAHLHIPTLDARDNRATSVSYNAITNILRKKLAFDGLIVTDALEMQGVTKYFEPGQLSAESFMAGNDILLLPMDVSKGVNAIKKYIKEGSITKDQLLASVKRILKSKYQVGLYKKPFIENIESIHDDINDNESFVLKQRMIEHAITLVKDKHNTIPIRDIVDRKFASLVIGEENKTMFQKRLDSYIKCRHFNTQKEITKSKLSLLHSQLKNYDVVFIAINDMSKYASKNHGISQNAIELIQKLNKETKVVLTLFGSPYALKYFDDQNHVLVAYEEEDIFQDVAVQGLFGAIPIIGHLPVTASDIYINGLGLERQSLGRIGYATPEYSRMSSDTLLQIDSLMNAMIMEKAAPGCQIIALRKGKVVFEKAYGHFTYEGKRPVNMDDIYDLASVTKVMASTLSLMKLESDGKFDTEIPIVQLLPVLDTSNKAPLLIKDILAHNAGLKSWIPFYKSTVTDAIRPMPMEKYYRETRSDSFDIPVAKSLYMRTDYRDSIWQKIYASGLYDEVNYKYSDLTFYLMERIIKEQSGLRLDEYARSKFYKPLNLRRTIFTPLEYHSLFDIVPTEKDDYFRKQVLQGHVHDMGAAMLGGVSGHAGLFSNAREIAILSQMILNGGFYGGIRFLDPNVISQYTTRHHLSTRRGLGWDMKELDEDKNMNFSEKASEAAFGHLGFTGTVICIDPEYDLVYILLANRTYPSMNNNKFGKNNYRPKVQKILYNSIMDD